MSAKPYFSANKIHCGACAQGALCVQNTCRQTFCVSYSMLYYVPAVSKTPARRRVAARGARRALCTHGKKKSTRCFYVFVAFSSEASDFIFHSHLAMRNQPRIFLLLQIYLGRLHTALCSEMHSSNRVPSSSGNRLPIEIVYDAPSCARPAKERPSFWLDTLHRPTSVYRSSPQ